MTTTTTTTAHPPVFDLQTERNRWSFCSQGGRWESLDTNTGDWRQLCQADSRTPPLSDGANGSILFPWVNRLSGEYWTLPLIGTKQNDLRVPIPGGIALHGGEKVINAEWRMIEHRIEGKVLTLSSSSSAFEFRSDQPEYFDAAEPALDLRSFSSALSHMDKELEEEIRLAARLLAENLHESDDQESIEQSRPSSSSLQFADMFREALEKEQSQGLSSLSNQATKGETHNTVREPDPNPTNDPVNVVIKGGGGGGGGEKEEKKESELNECLEDGEIRVTFVYRSERDLEGGYPTALECKVTYSIIEGDVGVTVCEGEEEKDVRGEGLRVHITVSNVDPELPSFVAVGFHPYFLNPFGGSINSMGLILRAKAEVKVDGNLLPTGDFEDLPLYHDFDVDEPRPIDSTIFDTPFLLDDSCEIAASLRIKNFQLSVAPRTETADQRMQVYIPMGRDKIALEPQSAIANSFHHPEDERYGNTALLPGETLHFVCDFLTTWSL